VLDRFFHLNANGTHVRREVVAGCTTFAAMAYILAVNPGILSAAGMDFGAVITATALASALMTAAMGVLTNYPIALAPGMGLNAFFAFTICGAMKVPWPAALGFVFYGGVLFLLLSATGLRRRIIEAIPHEMKLAIACGIGLFILFIGLKNGGVIVGDPVTFVRLGKVSEPSVLLVLGGILLTAVLVCRKVRGAIVLSVVVVTVLGLFIPAPDGRGMITSRPERLLALPASLAPTFLKLDLG